MPRSLWNRNRFPACQALLERLFFRLFKYTIKIPRITYLYLFRASSLTGKRLRLLQFVDALFRCGTAICFWSILKRRLSLLGHREVAAQTVDKLVYPIDTFISGNNIRVALFKQSSLLCSDFVILSLNREQSKSIVYRTRMPTDEIYNVD